MKLISAALVLGALTIGSATASAAVVCNDEGDCWRVRGRPTYDSGVQLKIYDDNWKGEPGVKFRWREPGRGHGYYRKGAWIEIR